MRGEVRPPARPTGRRERCRWPTPAAVSGWPFALAWWGLFLAVVVSFGVGVVSGLFPACLAARVEPGNALRGGAGGEPGAARRDRPGAQRGATIP